MLSQVQRSASHYHVKSPFNADDQIGPVGSAGLQKRFWAVGASPVEQNLSRLVKSQRYIMRA
jgi:hypothetical protein